MGQGDEILPGTSKMMTDLAMVPRILIAGLRSPSFKIKRSQCTLIGATLELAILSQRAEITRKVFKPSSMNHGNGSVVGPLTPVEHN